MTFREMLVEDLDQVMEIENDLISPERDFLHSFSKTKICFL